MSDLQYLPKNAGFGAFLRRFVINLGPPRLVFSLFGQLLATWRDRARMRRHLARMDDRLLRDIGLSWIDAKREINKPFWRG